MTTLFFFLTILVIISGVFAHIFVVKLGAFLDQHLHRDKAFWIPTRKTYLSIFIFLVTSVPLGYLSYLEFNPNQSGVPTTPDYYFWMLFLPLGMILMFIVVSVQQVDPPGENYLSGRSNKRYLHQVLTEFFNQEELKTLCFNLGVDFDSLLGEGKGNKARELVLFMDRHGRLSELESELERQRPEILSSEGQQEGLPEQLLPMVNDFNLLPKLPIFIVTGITLLIVVGGLYVRRGVLRETRTVYFLIDSSDEAKTYLHTDIAAAMKLKALTVPSRVNLALAAFGTGLESSEPCEDFIELVQPAPHETALLEIERVLPLLEQYQARNLSGVQEAIGFALVQLEGQKGIHQIIVMTTGADERCQPLDRDLLDQEAESLGLSYELVIVDLDESTTDDVEVFESASDRLFIVADDNREEKLRDILQDILTYPPAVYRSSTYDFPHE